MDVTQDGRKESCLFLISLHLIMAFPLNGLSLSLSLSYFFLCMCCKCCAHSSVASVSLSLHRRRRPREERMDVVELVAAQDRTGPYLRTDLFCPVLGTGQPTQGVLKWSLLESSGTEE